MGAIILSGVTIGDGAVIGCSAVVTSNVPPYAIVSGNPARLIRFRFTKEQIEDMLKINWWNWDIETIRKRVDLFYTDIHEFIRIFKNE